MVTFLCFISESCSINPMTFGTNGTLVSWVTPLRAMKVIHQWSIPLMNGQDYCILKPLTDRDLSPPKKHNFFNFTCFFWAFVVVFAFLVHLGGRDHFPCVEARKLVENKWLNWAMNWSHFAAKSAKLFKDEDYWEMSGMGRENHGGLRDIFWGGCSLLEACRCSQ